MRFLSIVTAPERHGPPSPEEMESMDVLLGEAFAEGWLIAAEGLMPTAFGVRIRKAGGDITVMDGPFAESKEVVGGFAILEAPSKEAAIERCRRFLAAGGDGLCELRQLWEAPGAVEAEKAGTEAQSAA